MSMFASAIPRWSTAQKLARIPAVPKILLSSSGGKLSLLSGLPIPDRIKMINATAAATIFLKNAFCIVGTSPDSRTKTDISEKKNAARRMNRIPFPLLPAVSFALDG